MITKTKTGTKASAAEYYSRPPLHIMLIDKGISEDRPTFVDVGTSALKQLLAIIARPESK